MSYDRLVRDPEKIIAQLLESCGLPWSDACLKFHESKIVVKTPSAWQVCQPLYHQSSGRWRHYERHLGPLIAGLAPWLGPDSAEADAGRAEPSRATQAVISRGIASSSLRV